MGFGMAPAAFNTNFGTGFNNSVSTSRKAQGIGTFHLPTIQTSPTGVQFELSFKERTIELLELVSVRVESNRHQLTLNS